MDSLVLVVDVLFVIRVFLDFMFFIFFSFAAAWAGWEGVVKKRNGFTKSIMHVAAASAGKFLMAGITGIMIVVLFGITRPEIVIPFLVITIFVQIWLGFSYLNITRELLLVNEETHADQPDHSPPVS